MGEAEPQRVPLGAAGLVKGSVWLQRDGMTPPLQEESFCCDSDSSWLKWAIKRPSRAVLLFVPLLSGISAVGRTHSPSGKGPWVVALLVQTGFFRKDVQSPAPLRWGM